MGESEEKEALTKEKPKERTDLSQVNGRKL